MVPPTLTERRRAAVLEWWEEQRRDLPWRRTRDPWEVLVCEVMAQQTQVARVAERWRPFLDRFPTPAALAAVPAAEVVRWWSGLGYNRRARDLHRCAQAVVDEHDGRLPDSLDALLALPGIGPYTARAVLAFAFERDHGIVDTNTARVLARWAGRRLRPREAQAAADASVPPGEAWAWNQAMLDLGATRLHGAATRACDRCPVAASLSLGVGRLPCARPRRRLGGRVGRCRRRFEGSDRQGRGRLVEALRQREVRDRRPRRGDGLARRPGPGGTSGGDARRRRPRPPRDGHLPPRVGPSVRKSTISPFTSAGFSTWRKWPGPVDDLQP